MRKPLSLCIVLALVGLCLIPQAALAYQKTDYLKYVGQDVGYDSACSYYRMCNPALSQYSIPAAKDKSGFDWEFRQAKGMLIKSWLEVSAGYPVKRLARVDTVCANYVSDYGNGTVTTYRNDSSCVQTPIYNDVTEYRWEPFNPMDGTAKIGAASCRDLRICGNYIPDSQGRVAIDNVLSFAGYEYPEYDWWNITFQNRYRINSSYSDNMANSINGTVGVKGEVIWTYMKNDSYVYSAGSDYAAPWAVANETDQKFWEFDRNLTGYNATSVWSEYSLVQHFSNMSFLDSGIINSTFNLQNVTLYNGTSKIWWNAGNYTNAAPEWHACLWVNDTGAGSPIDVGSTFTISIWFKAKTNTEMWPIGRPHDSPTGQPSYAISWSTFAVGRFAFATGSGAASWLQGTKTFSAGTWHNVIVTLGGGDRRCLYVDGVLDVCDAAAGKSPADIATDLAIGNFNSPDEWGIGLWDRWTDGFIEEVRIIKGTNVSLAWANATAKDGFDMLTSLEAEEAISLTLTFDSQTPSDINTVNIFNNNLTINYSIVPVGMEDPSEVWLNIKTNSSDDVFYYLNGTAYSGYDHLFDGVNTSSTWMWTLYDNRIYPGTYNINETYMERTAHSAHEISGNKTVKVQLLNVSGAKQYGIYEIMARNTTPSSNPLRIYYCNSTYSTGDVTSDGNCAQFGTIAASQTYNHTHYSGNTWHYTVPFGVEYGRVNNITVTNTSYFVSLASRPASSGWNIYNISGSNRTGSSQTSSNKGTAWTEFDGTFDSHLHQYSSVDSFFYYACANDTLGAQSCSAVRSDPIGLASLPPNAPDIITPTNTTYYEIIQVNYTASTSPVGYPMSFYNISIYNYTGERAHVIAANNSLLLTLGFNVTGMGVPFGTYFARVQVWDNMTQTAFSDSDMFTVQYWPGIQFCANDAVSGSALSPFNVTAYNATDTTTWTDISCGYFANITTVPTGPITITYSSVGYISSSYTTTISDTTFYNSTGALVASGSASTVRFHTFTTTYQLLTGVVLNAYIIVGPIQTLVGTVTTDAAGIGAFSLSTTDQYNITAARAGYDTAEFVIIPSLSDYSIFLTATVTNITGPSWANVLWYANPSGGTYSNDTTIPFTFQYHDYASITNMWGWAAEWNGTTLSSASYATQSGIVYLNITTSGRPGNITVYVYANRTGVPMRNESYIFRITTYSINQTYGSMCSWIQASSLGADTLNIIGCLIVVMMIATFSRLQWHVMGSGAIGLIVLGLLMWSCVVTLSTGIYIALWVIYAAALYLMRGI